MNGMLSDTLGRGLTDLRISVTDKCNVRCTYCMPKEIFGADHRFLARDQLLTYEEMTRLVRTFVDLGVTKVRLTGGEPLLRRDIERLVEMIAAIDGIEDLAMTTNGAFLAAKAQSLKDAGLGRVTGSLDALDDETFAAMNDVDFPVHRVLAGIEAADDAGLGPLKINAVVQRGINDDGIVDFARYFKGTGHVVRFIEYMDVGGTIGWNLDQVVPADEIVSRIDAEMPLEPVGDRSHGETSSRYLYRDGTGEIGVIASVTQPFCGGCVRARVSADGKLFTCLFSSAGHDLRAPIRSGASDAEMTQRISDIWSGRTDRYSEERSAETVLIPKVSMSYIGG
ncbi:MAG: GTP 3',8-cyclase MoaA [Actinomycetota bacterium]